MNIGIVGLPENDSTFMVKRKGSLKGIGKTLVMTAFGFIQYIDEGRKIYSNYHTEFSEYMPLVDFINLCKENKNIKNFTYLCDEVQTALSSLSESCDRIELYGTFLNQIRKRKGDFLYTAPRHRDAQIRLRQGTDFTLTTEKYHYSDDSLCRIDRCEKEHYVKVFILKPEYMPLNIKFNCDFFGKLYNTDEIVEREEID
jgi:hypothetical protein